MVFNLILFLFPLVLQEISFLLVNIWKIVKHVFLVQIDEDGI